MNKPYTCHHCSHQFDAYPEAWKHEIEVVDGKPRPAQVTVKCTKCKENGAPPSQMVYTLDITGTATLVT